MKTPRVSVCIPTYLGDKTLGAAIESVLAQTFTDFELIVIDDGSPDDTRAVVERFSDHRIVYLRNEKNLGPQGNWNRCLEVAVGDYFKLLPHDDLLHPQCLERQVRVLDTDTEKRIALVFCAREVLGPDARLLTRRGYPGGREGPVDRDVLIRACVRRGTNLIGEPGAVLLRKATAVKVGLFDATNPYVIDLDYWFRLLAHGDAHFCAEPLAAFRVSAGSWSVAIGARQSADFRNFVQRMADLGVAPKSNFDRVCGNLMAVLNNVLRTVFYRLYLK
jgi:glycosyltransferase involved in cell wall biosynthesis